MRCRILCPITFLWIVFVGMAMASSAFADIVEFQNGQLLELVILSETPDSYTAACAAGVISFGKNTVVTISPYSPDENKKLLKKWQMENPPTETLMDADVLPVPTQLTTASQTQETPVKYETTPEQSPWHEKLTEERTRGQKLKDDLQKQRADVKMREIITQGEKRRSREANNLLRKYPWQHTRTTNFLLFFQNAATGTLVKEKAEFFFRKIASDLTLPIDSPSFTVKNPIEIYVIEDAEQWKYILGGKYLVDSPNGFSKIFKKEIFIHITSNYDIEFILPHELSHILMREYVTQTVGKDAGIPLWLSEGMANFQGNILKLSASEEILAHAVQHRQLIPLSELMIIAEYPERTDHKTLFYAQATRLVEYLYVTFGRLSFIDVMNVCLKEYQRATQRGQTLSVKQGEFILRKIIESTFLKNTFSGHVDFEKAWIKSISELK